MILLALLWSLAGAYGLGFSLVVIVQAMAKEDFDALKVRIAHAAGNVGFEYGRKAGFHAGKLEGFSRGKSEAERAHTQFETEAKRGYWIGPKVTNELFVAPIVPPPELRYYSPTPTPNNAAIPTARFRCKVKAYAIDGVVFTMPDWECVGHG